MTPEYQRSNFSVSVLIATYGSDDWRELAKSRALPSAQAQEPCEILIAHDPEGTIASARNGLAERAMGEWLLYLDADDQLAPNFIGAMKRAAERHQPVDGPDVLLTPAVSYVRGGKPSPSRFLDRRPGMTLATDNYLVIGTMLSASLFHRVGGFPNYPHGFEDYGLWAKCWKAGVKVVKVPGAVYLAHVNPHSKRRQSWRDHRWQVETHERIQKELFPEGV